MKFLKSFESFNYKYWTIDLTKPDPYFEACLNKLGVDDEHKAIILYDKSIYSDGKKYAAIVKYGDKGSWQWSETPYVRAHKNTKYMGEVTVTEQEIINYKIITSANKYNL